MEGKNTDYWKTLERILDSKMQADYEETFQDDFADLRKDMMNFISFNNNQNNTRLDARLLKIERAISQRKFSVTIEDETSVDIVLGDKTPADISSEKPSFRDNMVAFDEKMFSLGMKRSPTQFNTPADGNCGPEGIRNYRVYKILYGTRNYICDCVCDCV